MAHFVSTTEKTLAKGVVRLFWDNIWKLHDCHMTENTH